MIRIHLGSTQTIKVQLESLNLVSCWKVDESRQKVPPSELYIEVMVKNPHSIKLYAPYNGL